MKKSVRILLGVLASISLLLLTACQAAATPPPTATPTAAATLTVTDTPAPTDTATFTPTPTDTPTITPTFTQTLPYNAPGTYYFKKCTTFPPDPQRSRYLDTVNFCLTSVRVEDDGTMRFTVNWSAWTERNFYIQLDSYQGNMDMVLVDNLKNEYRQTQVGGCAATATQLKYSRPDCSGWFLFPAAKPGATSFSLVDFSHSANIDNIVLLPAGVGTATNTPVLIGGTPYNVPGTYTVYKCVTFVPGGALAGASRVDFCITTVVVNADGTMRFNVSWKVYYNKTGYLRMESYANDESVFLTDDLGNEYHHTGVGGCAAKGYNFNAQAAPNSCGGWFVFPAPKPGATSFRLSDFRNVVTVENIVLVPKAG